MEGKIQTVVVFRVWFGGTKSMSLMLDGTSTASLHQDQSTESRRL